MFTTNTLSQAGNRRVYCEGFVRAAKIRDRRARTEAKRKTYHHGNLRSALIGVACEILETEGVDGLSMRRAARQAGVSQTAPYRHFSSKEALLAAVAATGFRELADRQVTAAARFDEPAARIQAMGMAYVAFATAHPALFRLMFSAAFADKTAYPELYEAGMASFAPFSKAVAEHLAPTKPTDVDTETAMIAGWALVHGLANLLVEGYGGKGITPRLDEPGLIGRVTATFVKILNRADGPGA